MNVQRLRLVWRVQLVDLRLLFDQIFGHGLVHVLAHAQRLHHVLSHLLLLEVVLPLLILEVLAMYLV